MRYMPYKRSSRLSGEIYQILAEACYSKLSDPRLKGIQLTKIDMTDDLQLVKVFYYLEGSEDDKKRCLKGLRSAKGFLKKCISGKLGLRVTPDIKFFYDEGLESAEKMDKILRDLKENGQMGEE